MNNKTIVISSIAGSVLVGVVLGLLKNKREKEAEAINEECMSRVRDSINDAIQDMEKGL